MAKEQKSLAMRRKLHVLRNLTNSKSVKQTSIILEAFLCIYKLKLQIQAIQNEYLYLMQHIQEVKVEKIEKGLIQIRVACKKGKDLLVSILEVFERMGLCVVHARATCNYIFGMEAIVEAHQDQTSDVTQMIREAILNAIQIQSDG